MARTAKPTMKAKPKAGVKIPASKSKKANENWMPTERDKLAMYYTAAMLDSRFGEIRRAGDRARLVQRGYELADTQIEYSSGKA